MFVEERDCDPGPLAVSDRTEQENKKTKKKKKKKKIVVGVAGVVLVAIIVIKAAVRVTIGVLLKSGRLKRSWNGAKRTHDRSKLSERSDD